MESFTFRHYRCFFLPVGAQDKWIETFGERGGSSDDACENETDFIVAESWKEVEEHFAPYPGLLQYFLSEDVCPVSYGWLRMCIESKCIVNAGHPYLLSPMEACRTEVMGSSVWGSKCVEFPSRTREEFNAMLGSYERNTHSVFYNLEKIHNDAKKERDAFVVGSDGRIYREN